MAIIYLLTRIKPGFTWISVTSFLISVTLQAPDWRNPSDF